MDLAKVFNGFPVLYFSAHYLSSFFIYFLAIKNKPKDILVNNPRLFLAGAIVFFSAVIFSKIAALIYHYDQTIARFEDGWTPVSIFLNSGYVYLGSIIGYVTGIFITRRLFVPRPGFLQIADYAFPFLMLLNSIQRLGCFYVGCCYGKPTTLPWGCVFIDRADSLPRHPTQIYLSFFLLVVFLITRHIYKEDLPQGTTTFSVLFLYGFFRFFIEFLRDDSFYVAGNLTFGHIVALVILLPSAFVLDRILRKHHNEKQA